MVSTAQLGKIQRALPFWSSLLLVPLAWAGAIYGGWWLIAVPLSTWYLFSILDAFTGLYLENADPQTGDETIFWYRLITILWPALQFFTLFGVLAYVGFGDHQLSTGELIGLFFGVGVLTGTVGINYSHELMHQKPNWERWLGDILLAMVLYSHFRSEHLLVHYRYVATPRDHVTARYNQGFHRVFPWVIWTTLRSAWLAEKAMLARRKASVWNRKNPFWRFTLLQGLALVLAYVLAGWLGVALFVWQSYVAIPRPRVF